MKKISNKIHQGALTITFIIGVGGGGGGGGRGVFFAGIELYLDKLVQVFLSLNPRASVPSVATDDRKQFQCLHIV